MEYRVWHGTNQDFDRFDRDLLGMNTNNDSSRRAFYFADDQEVAWDYALFAARNLIPNQVAHQAKVDALLSALERAAARGDFLREEALTAELEELEFGALRTEPSGAVLLHCEITLENPLEIDASNASAILDVGAVMDRAQGAGHDGLILRNIHDTPTGQGAACDHFAVFDANAIRILDRIHDLEEAPDPDKEICLETGECSETLTCPAM